MTYEQISRIAKQLGETNDCVVRSVALVTGLSYETVHQALETAGRAHRDGTEKFRTRKALKALGFRVLRAYSKERLGLEVGTRHPTTGHALENPEAWEHLPNLLLFTPRHAAAFVQGRVEDWTKDEHAPVQEAWELARVNAPLRLGTKPPPVVYL